MSRRLDCRPSQALTGLLLVVYLLLVPYSLVAEIPAVTALFPSGVQAGQSVTVKVQGALGTVPMEVWSDRTDVSIRSTEKLDEYVVTATAEARPGMVWLRWHHAEGASELRPLVIGTLPEIVEIEPNNAVQAAQGIATLPVLLNGTLDKRGDIDGYLVTLKVNETLVASVEANQTLPSPMDAVLQITDSHGFVIEQNDDSLGTDPQMVWTAPTDGTWLVRVFAFPAQPDSSIQYAGGSNYIYRLRLTTGPVVDHVIPLVRQPGAVISRGWNLPAEPLTLLGDPTTLRFAPFSSGITATAAFSLDQYPEHVGTAMIEDSTAAVQSIVVPGSITGMIETTGDRDQFQFTALKGQVLRVRTYSRPLGSLLDPVIRIRNVTNTTLVDQDDKDQLADPDISYTIPVDGDYMIEVSDRYQSGSERHFYAVTIQPEIPEMGLSVASNRFTLDRAKPLEIPVTISRRAGLNVPIQFTAQGLPAGVTLEPVESKPEGDTSKTVTFRLSVSPDAVAARGPIQIVGTTIGPDRTSRVTAPIEGLSSTTDQLWLTLPALPVP